jgi:peptidyl-tRNA hydrolase, PTH1 family
VGTIAAAPRYPWLIVGLGNPGSTYAGNRHNVGFMVAEAVSDRLGGRFKAHRSNAEVIEGRLAASGHRVVLAKPRTYMNESGGPVAALRDFFGVPIDNIVIVHDELDLGYGVVRVKQGGGDNGHNGLRSITKALGGPGYARVRFGIGRPPGRMDPAAFVLKNFAAAERDDLSLNVDHAADIVESLVVEGLVRTQTLYHADDRGAH